MKYLYQNGNTKNSYRIQLQPDTHPTPTTGGVVFALGVLVKPGVVGSFSSFGKCRDLFCGRVKDGLINAAKGKPGYKKLRTDKFLYLSYLAVDRAAKKKSMGWEERINKFFNPIEDELGWSRTRAREMTFPVVNGIGYGKFQQGVVILAGPKWMRAVPMVSFHALITRALSLAVEYEGPPVKTLEGTINHLSRLARGKTKNSLADKNRLRIVLPKMKEFLPRFEEFYGKGAAENRLSDGLFQGIQNFFNSSKWNRRTPWEK